MKPITLILLCVALCIILPAKSNASFYVPKKAALPFHNKRSQYAHHFAGGHSHTFSGIFGLGCSMLGSVAVVATFAAAIVAAPAGIFAAAAMGFSILGILSGFASHDDPAGSTAIGLGLINLLAFYLGGAIYSATMGNYLPLLKFASKVI